MSEKYLNGLVETLWDNAVWVTVQNMTRKEILFVLRKLRNKINDFIRDNYGREYV